MTRNKESAPDDPVRKIADPERLSNGLIKQPSEVGADREVEENHNRERFANHFKYADLYAGNTRTFDPKGNYNCGACNQANGDKCLLVKIPKIDRKAGSCGDWENLCAGDPEVVLEEKSPEVASYGVAENGVGFGCHRCPFASKAKEADSKGRTLYCGKGDFRVFPNACCALNGAPVKGDANEAAGSLSNGQVMRSKAKKESATTTKDPQKIRIREMNVVQLKEAVVDEKGNKRYPVVIISQGLGNLRDRNFYTPEAIASGVKVYEGAKACIDHPTEEEEQNHPNRQVMDLTGHYENVQVGKAANGGACLEGELVPIAGVSCLPTTERLDHAIAYKKRYPDKNFVGISINGDGKGQKMSYDEFMSAYGNVLTPQDKEKLKQVEGQDINAITELTDRVSADVVTEPGAGGVVKPLKESNFKPKRRVKMFKAMKDFFSALESGDKKAIENAQGALAKETARSTTEDDDKAQKEAKSKEKAGLMAEALKCAKKENKKEENESEEAYEARMMQAAMEAVEKKEADAAAAANKDGKDGKNKDGQEDDKDKGGKGGKGKDDDDDDDDDDGEKPSAKDMKALKSKNEELAKEVEELKGKLEKKEDAGKKAAEEAAVLATKLSLKERNELIDKALSKCGLRREVTQHWKPVLEQCRDEKQINETIKKMVETAKKVLEEAFEIESSYGLIEKQAADSGKSNDDLFLK